MTYRVIAWDFDGTLVDSLDGALAIYNQLADEYGFVPIEDPAPVREMTIPEFLKAHRIPLSKVPVVYTKFLRAQTKQLQSVQLHTELRELLDELRRRSFQLAVISSNTPENIRVCLDANGIEDRFDNVLGYSRLFGKESAIRRVIKSQQLRSPDVLYVGDEVRDIAAARKAEVDIASVTWGFNSEQALEEARPDYLIRSPGDFYALLDRWEPTG